METSTPVTNRRSMAPPSRTSFGGGTFEMTPLRNNRPSVAFRLDISNDDAERAERRRSIALRRSISNLPPAVESPGLNESARVLSEDDIKAHLQICTKLHAENKINVKNAWSLKIIDVLRQLVTKNNPDLLKVAGNSLEIAGKVYGLRVDDLHAEGLKLAGSLARNFNKRPREDEEEDEENVDPNAPPKEKRQKKTKQKKRRALLSGDKKHTVNADPKSWKGTIPKLESATFSVKTDTAVSAVGNLFTNKVRMDPAGYMFKFLSKEPAWQWTPGNDPSVKEDSNKKFPVKIKPVVNLMLCAPFRDFQVDEWDPDEENKELAKRSSMRLDEVVCDDDGIPIPELDGSIHDVFQGRDFDDLNEDELMIEEGAIPHIHQEIQHIVDFRPTEQSLANPSEKSEYSYNNVITTAAGKIDQIWAGPSHWKLKFIRRSQPVYTGRDMQNEEKKKRKGRKKKKEPVHIDCRQLPAPIDFSHYEKKQLKKKKHTVDESKITLPLFDFSCQQLLENIEGLMTIPSMKPTKKRQPEVDYQVEGYRFDNPNDSAYVPHDGNDDNGADLGDDHFDNGDIAGPLPGTPDSQEGAAAGPLHGMALVEAPEMVPQSYIHYATKAKRMDMKKLKQAVWCSLTDKPNYDTSATVIPTTFSQMYKEIPKRLPEKMNQEMSCPLAFVALLHLANEQNLKLKQEDFTDFQISGPPMA